VEKVSKNRFPKKFRGIFRGKSLFTGKNVQKIGPKGDIRHLGDIFGGGRIKYHPNDLGAIFSKIAQN
jgi:hypothetical protein